MEHAPSSEEVRAGALAALADPRARAVLAAGELVVQPSTQRWEASGGTVHAHRVLLGLDAPALALLEQHPAVLDEITEALAAFMASREGEALSDVRAYWALEAVGQAQGAPYRGARPAHVARDDPSDVLRGMRAFVAAAGDERAQELLARAAAELERGRGGWRLVLHHTGGDFARVRGDAHLRARLEVAARALLSGPDGAAVWVEHRAR